jgi:hypothetical protein
MEGWEKRAGRGPVKVKVDQVTLCTTHYGRPAIHYYCCRMQTRPPVILFTSAAASQSPTTKGVSIDSRVHPTISNQGYLMQCDGYPCTTIPGSMSQLPICRIRCLPRTNDALAARRTTA